MVGAVVLTHCTEKQTSFCMSIPLYELQPINFLNASLSETQEMAGIEQSLDSIELCRELEVWCAEIAHTYSGMARHWKKSYSSSLVFLPLHLVFPLFRPLPAQWSHPHCCVSHITHSTLKLFSSLYVFSIWGCFHQSVGPEEFRITIMRCHKYSLSSIIFAEMGSNQVLGGFRLICFI